MPGLGSDDGFGLNRPVEGDESSVIAHRQSEQVGIGDVPGASYHWRSENRLVHD